MSLRTEQQITDDLVEPVLRPHGRPFVLLVSGLGAVVAAGLSAFAYQLYYGFGVTGTNWPVYWGLYLTSFVFCATLVFAQPSFAEWEGSKAEDNLAKAVDATVIRPLALLRVFVGAVFLVPTAVLTSPGGR